MKFKEFQVVLAATFIPLLVLWGCQGNRPLSPVKIVNMGVSLDLKNVRATSTLQVTSDMILYNITGPGHDPITGSDGPVSTASINFTIPNVPVGAGQVLSLQMNDAGTGQPLGIGAVALDASVTEVTPSIAVTLGSLIRSCYNVSMTQADCSDDEELNFGNYTYNNDAFLNGPASGISSVEETEATDIALVPVGESQTNPTCVGAYDLVDGWTGTQQSIAYLGNGQIVNFDSVPATFYVDGGSAKAAAGAGVTTVATGDVFCVKLEGGTVPGHAWMQITDPGNTTTGPSIIFRLRNDATPYYLYDQSSEDSFISNELPGSSCNLSCIFC